MSFVIHGNIKLNTVLPSGAGDAVITVDPSTKLLGEVGAIDTNTFIPKTLPAGNIIIGNASNEAVGVVVSGDVTTTPAGVFSISSGVIVNDDVNAVAGMWMPSFGIQPDVGRNARHSFNYFFRGGASTLDVLDIANTITGTWTGAITYDGSPGAFPATGSSGCYSPCDNQGRMFYMNLYTASAVNQMFRFDVQNRVLSPYTPTDFLQSGTAAVGNRMASYAAIDGTDLYDVVLLLSHTSTIAQELIPLV